MAFAKDCLFVAVFTIDGVPHAMRGFAVNEKTATLHVGRIIKSRNANVPDEETKLEKLHFDITPQEAKAIENQVRESQPEDMTIETLAPNQPAKLLHKSVSDLQNEA